MIKLEETHSGRQPAIGDGDVVYLSRAARQLLNLVLRREGAGHVDDDEFRARWRERHLPIRRGVHHPRDRAPIGHVGSTPHVGVECRLRAGLSGARIAHADGEHGSLAEWAARQPPPSPQVPQHALHLVARLISNPCRRAARVPRCYRPYHKLHEITLTEGSELRTVHKVDGTAAAEVTPPIAWASSPRQLTENASKRAHKLAEHSLVGGRR